MKFGYTVICTILAVLPFGSGKSLPSNFPVCKRSQPDLNECFSRAVETVLKYLKNPVPEIGLPSIDPWEIEKIAISSPGTSNINLDVTFYNVKIYNLIDSVVNKSSIVLGEETNTLTCQVFAPQHRVTADYEMKGQILLLPFSGKGKSEILLLNPQSELIIKGKYVTKNGVKYIQNEEVVVDSVPERVSYKFDNLVNGNGQLSEELVKVMNENWREIYADLKEPYNKIQGSLLKNLGSQVLNKIPFDELFPA